MQGAFDPARRNLLRGRRPASPLPIRPPGAMPENRFTDACTACGDCMSACPEQIIVRGSGGFPEVDFRRGECTFCDACIEACGEDALDGTMQPAWSLFIQLGQNCLARQQVVCQACGDVCGPGAIRFRPRLGQVATPSIDRDACTGCGACIGACPQDALSAVNHGS